MNGEQAVDMFIESEEGTYKAVFMDIEMPVLDGYKASLMIRGLNRRDKNIPIIALTANAFQSDREKALKAGMDDYLTKPLKMEALSELLHKEDAIHLLERFDRFAVSDVLGQTYRYIEKGAPCRRHRWGLADMDFIE